MLPLTASRHAFAFGFDFGGYFVNHGFLFFNGRLFWSVVGKVEAVHKVAKILQTR